MIWTLLGCLAPLAVGLLFCTWKDARQHYAFVQRIVIGVMFAIVLGTVLYAAEIKQTSCNDLEKYSFLWYANFCFLDEQSS